MADKIVRTGVWKGLNRAPYIADGEMRNMKNLSSDAYPYITTRRGRVPYKFQTSVPGVPGDGYIADVENLPEASEEEEGNIYRVKPSENGEFAAGEFYHYTDGKWERGIKDEIFKGVTEKTIAFDPGEQCLLSALYRLYDFEDAQYVYSQELDENIPEEHTEGVQSFETALCAVKFIGEDTGFYQKGKTYVYKVNVEAYWKKVEAYRGDRISTLPAPTKYFANKGTTFLKIAEDEYYRCYLRGHGYWEEVEDFYEPVTEMPINPQEGKQVRFVKPIYGSPLNAGFYISSEDMCEGVSMYFYASAQSTDEASVVTYLPEATAENIGKVYRYAGVDYDGGFSECVRLESGEYKWETVAHPQVTKMVTVGEWIKIYGGTIKEIIEIAAFCGKIAVLYITEDGAIELYYDEKTYNITNCTLKPGKKLSVVGNKLIVGESGSYLHIKNGAAEFYSSPSSFSGTITAGYVEYGNGGGKYRCSVLKGDVETGTATLKFIAPANKGDGFGQIYNALCVEGVKFTVTFDSKTYELISESAELKINYEHAGYTVGDTIYREYIDQLTIYATGVLADFYWSNEGIIGNPFIEDEIAVTLASSEPHYYDVTAWKKRMWGYEKNVLYGTAADIFTKVTEDAPETVDWTRGDNTYLEAISQPIWQGGNITGLAALSNALILFKEDSLTVFTGSYPAIMSASTIPCRGLCAENRESVAVGNEAIYYLSQDGVYKFTGGIPQCISMGIKIKGTEAVGASDGNKYWLSLKEEDGIYALYVYDTNLGIWHKEDNTRVSSFTMLGGEMYMADADTNEVYNICAPQEDVKWELELWFDEGTYKLKKYKKLTFRGSIGECEAFIKANDGEWQVVNRACGSSEIILEPFCCEELTIKLRGKGICEIKSLERQFEVIE